MNRFCCFLLVLLISLLAVTPHQGVLSQDTTDIISTGLDMPFMPGMSVVLYNNDSTMAINTPDFFDNLEARNLGVTSLILTFPIFQDGISATKLYEDPILTPTEENLRIFIREAHLRGITVWLKPLIDDSRLGQGKWRGGITPGNDLSNLVTLEEWFVSYGELIVKYARIAGEEGAYGIVIGTEMESLDKPLPKYVDRWNTMIFNVRQVFGGKVSYAKNWTPLELPGFASSLDVLMVDAFFDLDLPNYATEDAIYWAWKAWERPLQEYKQLGLPIMFAEVGIVPRVGAYRTPWNGNNGNPIDVEAQARYYRATCRFAREIGINGLYWWATGFYDHHRNQYDRFLEEQELYFGFYDFPAEEAVRECYAASD